MVVPTKPCTMQALQVIPPLACAKLLQFLGILLLYLPPPDFACALSRFPFFDYYLLL